MRRLALAPLLVVTACFSSLSSGPPDLPPGDAGPDASLGDGAGPDATVDAPAEAAPGTGAPDATVDAGSPVDSGGGSVDSGASPDTGAVLEAGGEDAAMTVEAGGSDAAPAPILLGASTTSAKFALGSDGIYFMVASQRTLFRAPFGGAAGVALVTDAVAATGFVGPIATDATNVYWQDGSNNDIYALPLGSSPGATPVAISTSSQLALGLHMLAYQGWLYMALDEGGFERVSIAGGASPATNAPVVMAGGVSCGAEACNSLIAVTPAALLWTIDTPASQGGGIYGSPLDADAGFLAPGTEVLSVDYPAAIAADSNNLYWVTSGATGNNGGAYFAPLSDAGAVVTVASGIGIANGLAVDTSTDPPTLYWANRAGTGTVVSASAAADASVVTLAANQGMPYDIGANAQAVVWVDWFSPPDGGVYEIVK
jgi:hypothetical protein